MTVVTRNDPGHDLTAWLAAATPGLVLMLCVVIGRLPLGVPHLGSVAPLLPLAAVFFWSVRRPELMTPTMVFLAGLVDDVLGGTPLGLGALVLLLVRWLVVSQRRVFLGKPFALMWWGFAIVAMAAVTMAWLVGGVARGALIPAGSIAVQLALTMIAFPAVVWVFGRIDHLATRAR
ncbi:MAG: rod shape-determining protein MreD [Alphaproteobacteria bacterium]